MTKPSGQPGEQGRFFSHELKGNETSKRPSKSQLSTLPPGAAAKLMPFCSHALQNCLMNMGTVWLHTGLVPGGKAKSWVKIFSPCPSRLLAVGGGARCILGASFRSAGETEQLVAGSLSSSPVTHPGQS